MTQVSTSLPNLDTDYALTPDQIASFQKNGHIMLPGVCSPDEIAGYRPVLNAATERYKTENRPMEERDTYGKAFLQIMNLWVRDEQARRFTMARRFAKIAADLMQAEGARLYHDQALYKEAHGGHTPWHQDQYYWPLDTQGIQAVTMWMPLVDVSIDMGALTFASGSQQDGFMGHIEISDKSEEIFADYVAQKGYPVHNEVMRAGDATFHAGWTLHCAPGNASDTMREVMTIIYFADGIRILTPDNPNRQDDLEGWLPGLKPGDLAASELNPLLYHR
jgi:ectoine hydroxylase-related dioxygenase (phytanoyl-CoA dioxygenase family)